MPQNYELKISEHQAQVMMEALELVARLKMGQIDALWYVLSRANTDRSAFEKSKKEMKQVFFPELDEHSFYGAGWDSLHGDGASDVAFDMYQVIRHRLSWDKAGNPKERDWSRMQGRSFDEPHQRSNESLIMMRKTEN